MPRGLIHHAVTDPDNHLIGYVRDLLIDEADWKVRCHGLWASGDRR
jgi:hypothetical protein